MKKWLNITRVTQIGLFIAAMSLASIGLFPLLQGHKKPPQDDWPKPDPMPDYIGARLGIINYVDDELATVFIDKQWAGNAAVLSYNSGTCCVKIPTHWRPGMKMLISWASASMRTGKEEPSLAEREVEVPPYPPFHDGYVWAIFLPGGEIRVQPSFTGPGGAGFLDDLPRPRVATKAQIEKFIRDSAPRKGP